MAAQSHVYFINVFRNGRWHSSGFSMRSTSAAKVRAKYLLQHPSVRPGNIKAVRHSASRKVANPRVACGSVSSKRNKYVGATYTKRSGAAAGHRRVIGCARVGDDEGYYATRRVGAKGTRYTPVKKRALRDLKSTHKGAVKLPRHKGVKHTSAALISAWEKRYAKPAKRKGHKMSAADKAAFVKRMAKARARKGR